MVSEFLTAADGRLRFTDSKTGAVDEACEILRYGGGVSDDGYWTGHVDLGALGVADRWADLAIATWSCDWNYGPGWQDTLLNAYGIDPDPIRTRYYRVLWDLDP